MKTILPTPAPLLRLPAALALLFILSGSAGAHFWGASGGSPSGNGPAPVGSAPPAPPRFEPDPAVPRQMTVYLFADSSYREGAADAALAFSKANPWARVVPRFAPSGELVDRIRRGEEADLVLLDGALARKLAEEGLLTRGSMATVGRSPLVFAGREGTRARRIGDLPALSRIVAADPARHPSGVYALEAMRKGAVRGGEYGEAEGEDGKGGKGGGTENLSCTAADGREALAALARGEAEGAFAFRTDVDAVPSARVLFVVPRTLYGSPDVVVALTPMAGSNDGALCLFRFFRSADGKRSLARHGVETGE